MTASISPRLNARQFGMVCASVFAAVLPHLPHLRLPFSALILILLIGRWIQRQRDEARIPGWIKLPLIALFPVWVIMQYGNVFGREPGSALACAMLVLKLLETENRRDARAVICFASFVLMSALLFDTSLSFTLLLFGALLLLLATLRELEPRPALSRAVIWRQALLLDFRTAAVALLAAIPLAICVFVFFPRLDSPLWRTPGDISARTGIGDSMSPGAIQSLLVDDSPAFRVSFDATIPSRSQLYWRGPVLTDFDGTTWTRRDIPFSRLGPGSVETIGAATSYEVTLEPSDKPWLFALDVPLDAPAETQRGSDLSLVRRRPVGELLRYRVSSAMRFRLDPILTAGQREAAIALPPDFDPRSIALAQGWRRDLGKDDAIIRTALDLFHETFFYTLSPPGLGRDSIDDFLFTTQRGFCEHYAAAFVFLMRAAGIPARVVTGYQGGFFNAIGNYLLVRQSDAHAWSEVWLESRGWVRVDPTAAVSPQRIEFGAQAAAGDTSPWYQAGWVLGMRNQLDLINRGWNSIVVQFNALRQQSLLTPFGVDKADFAALTWVLIGSSSVLLCLIALWVMRTPRREIDPLDAAYAALCVKLARAGIRHEPTEGAHTYAQRLQDLHTLAGQPVRQAQALLGQYVSLRYAHALPAADAVAAFARAVRGLRVAHATNSAEMQD